MKFILIISHGSHSSRLKEELYQLISALKQRSDINQIECAFLEIASPSIPEGIDFCVRKGAKEIIILLNFLNSGKHVDQDIPDIVNQARDNHPDVNIVISEPVGQHKRIPELFLDMVKKLS